MNPWNRGSFRSNQRKQTGNQDEYAEAGLSDSTQWEGRYTNEKQMNT